MHGNYLNMALIITCKTAPKAAEMKLIAGCYGRKLWHFANEFNGEKLALDVCYFTTQKLKAAPCRSFNIINRSYYTEGFDNALRKASATKKPADEIIKEIEDAVNHPGHYTKHPSGVECIQITEHMNFNCGNAVKYIWRADLKHDDGGIEDLEKAEFYIKREITRRKSIK